MRKGDLKDKGAVQAAVRQVAEGVPARRRTSTRSAWATPSKAGKRTRRLALQFTVGRKLAPEQLEAARTRPIPPRITANGIEFDTDVVERSFEHHPTAVEVEAKTERKRRLDPMMPGISIGHVDSTAGTLGCLVREIATGETAHAVQLARPPRGDRPRSATRSSSPARTTTTASRRTCAAGSCAASSGSPATARSRASPGATPSRRSLELDVGVRAVGDPELDDRVVKSGRTTGVTYGLVTRVHTITKLAYGATGERQIGGFEIGPDEENPAERNEISMGGDSGSAWMAVTASGTATRHDGRAALRGRDGRACGVRARLLRVVGLRAARDRAARGTRRGRRQRRHGGRDRLRRALPARARRAPARAGRRGRPRRPPADPRRGPRPPSTPTSRWP